jgi:L-lactate dehydrogenase (cytochrome)
VHLSLIWTEKALLSQLPVIRDEVETAMRLCGMTDLMRDACPDYTNTASIDCLVPPPGHPYARKIRKAEVKL